MMEEIWKTLGEYPGYEFSSLGRVRSNGVLRTQRAGVIAKMKPKILSVTVNTTWGYCYVALGKFGGHRVHRLIARAFIPNPNDLPQVNHINGDKTDNRPDNLEWCTQSKNIKHAYDNGLMPREPRNRKLSKEDVWDIRALKYVGASVKDIADYYHVTIQSIHYLLKGITWANV